MIVFFYSLIAVINLLPEQTAMAENQHRKNLIDWANKRLLCSLRAGAQD